MLLEREPLFGMISIRIKNVSTGRECMKAAVKTHCLMLIFALGAVLVSAPSWSIAPEAEFSNGGMVASRSKIASAVGADILARGGNAVDATVAVGFALAVTYPSAGNVGGGGFLVIRMSDGTVATNDHREKAPLAATRDMYLDEEGNVVPDRSTHSHLAVGVPGTVAGLLDALEKFGTMSRAQVLAPAIQLARRGFALDLDLARSFERRLPQFAQYEASAAVFSKDGDPYARGDRFRQKDLAAVLSRVKKHGKDGFYQGKTADLIVAEMQRGGGLISHEDLTQYQSVWRDPILGSYRGHDIISMPPPSSGGVLVVQMLNMLESVDVGAMGYGSAELVHHIIEAERRAYADRAEHLGDPDFYPVPIQQLVSKAYATERFADFNPAQASRSAAIGPGQWPLESPDTTHASVIDKDGNAVSYTTTLNLSYGSKIVAAGTGILLNNEMDDFSVAPGIANAFGLLGAEANSVAARKRPLSSMSPTLVMKDGKPIMTVGAAGGPKIISQSLLAVLRVIEMDMSVEEALQAPRFHHQWSPDRLLIENSMSKELESGLTKMGHKTFRSRTVGVSQAIGLDKSGRFVGAHDPRVPGKAAGH